MSQRVTPEVLLQEALLKTDASLSAGAAGTAWLLLVNVEGIQLSEGFNRQCLQVRVKYGDEGAYESLTTGEVLNTTSPQMRGHFGTTCAFAWRREIEPVVRFSVRYDKFMARSLAKAELRVPFCEARSSGWLVRPGRSEQELPLSQGLRKVTNLGHIRVSLEMRGIPKDTFSGAGLPPKMLLQARIEELQGSVLLGSTRQTKGDSADDQTKLSQDSVSKVVLGHPPLDASVDDVNLDSVAAEYPQRADSSFKVSL